MHGLSTEKHTLFPDLLRDAKRAPDMLPDDAAIRRELLTLDGAGGC